jgi:hypothetical protein
MDLSQFGISSDTTGGGTGLNIPGLSGIQSSLSIITIVSLVVTVLFVVLYVINVIRGWRVDQATIETRKDIRAIRTLLEAKETQPEKQSQDAVAPSGD